MGDKSDLIAEMVEAELLAEQARANERQTSPPKEEFARVAVADAAVLPEPAEPLAVKRRVVEHVVTARDPRREDSEPPPSFSTDPDRAPTKPPPPGYGSGQTE